MIMVEANVSKTDRRKIIVRATISQLNDISRFVDHTYECERDTDGYAHISELREAMEEAAESLPWPFSEVVEWVIDTRRGGGERSGDEWIELVSFPELHPC